MNGTQRKHEAGIHAKFINGYSKGCSVKATAEEYAQMGVVLGVDILVGPINTAIVPAASGCSNDASSVPIIPGSNMRKKVDKGIQFLEALVSSLKNKQQITNITTPRVFAVLDGQDDLKARWWNTVQLKEKFQEDDEIIAGYVVPLFFLQPSTFEHDGGDDAAGCKMKETITPAKPSTQVFSSAFIFDAQLVSSSHRHQHHQQQEEVEERRGRDRQETIKKVLQTTFAALPANKPRVVVGVGSLEDIRTCIECGVDLIDGSWLANLAERGIVLNLEGESTPTSSSSYCINPHSSSSSGNYTQDMAVLVPGCGCFACSGEMHYARSYIQHLYEVGEMLGYAILQIHNHHQCSEWMQRIREEI